MSGRPSPRADAPTLLTVGHSTRTPGQFLALLEAHRVGALVDVRRHPRSRRHPHFSSDALAPSLEAAGIAYVHEPDLGGFRTPRPGSPNGAWDEPAFQGYADHLGDEEVRAALDRMEALAVGLAPRGLHVAACCAEARPENCHRRVLSDALLARGLPVLHVLDLARAEPHEPPPFAVFADGGVTYPPPQPSLFG